MFRGHIREENLRWMIHILHSYWFCPLDCITLLFSYGSDIIRPRKFRLELHLALKISTQRGRKFRIGTHSAAVWKVFFSSVSGLVKRSRNVGSGFGSDPVTHMWNCLQSSVNSARGRLVCQNLTKWAPCLEMQMRRRGMYFTRNKDLSGSSL